MDRIYITISHSSYPLCLLGKRFTLCHCFRNPSWLDGRCSRGSGAGGMGHGKNTLCRSITQTIAILAAIATLLLPAGIVQVIIIAAAGLVGWFLFKNSDITSVPTSSALRSLIPRAFAIACLALFTALLVLFLLPNLFYQLHALVLFASFYRTGSLVFGGGHVVLPLLQAAVVLPGWVTETQFLTGYSAAQAVPGPLFTFSAYLGAIETPSPNGWLGAIIALLGIYLPLVPLADRYLAILELVA